MFCQTKNMNKPHSVQMFSAVVRMQAILNSEPAATRTSQTLLVWTRYFIRERFVLGKRPPTRSLLTFIHN